MGIADLLFGWTAGSPERQAREQAESEAQVAQQKANAAALETEAEYRKQQSADAKRKADLERAQETWYTKNYGQSGVPYGVIPGGLVPILAQYQMSTGQLAPPDEWENIYAKTVYGQAPGERSKLEADTRLTGGKASLIDMVTKGLTPAAQAEPSAPPTPSQGFMQGGGMDINQPFTRATGQGGVPNLASMPNKVSPLMQLANTPEGRFALDAAGMDPDKLTPKLTWRDNVKVGDQFGQAAFDPFGNIVPETFQPGKLDAQIQMVRQPDNSLRAVNVGGPNSPFPGREIAIENGKVVDKGEVKGSPELVKQTIQMADGSEMEVFVPMSSGSGAKTKQSPTALPVAEKASDYIMPDGTAPDPRMSMDEINRRGGKRKVDVPKEKATSIVTAQTGIEDLRKTRTAIKNPDGTYNRTELFKMMPFGNVWHIAIPGTSGVQTLASWTNALEGTIRDESGAAVSPSEFSRLFQRYPLSYTMSDSEIDSTFTRLEKMMSSKMRTLDFGKASEWEKANGIVGTKDGKKVIVMVDDGLAPKVMPKAEHFKDLPAGKVITDQATGMQFIFQGGQVVRVK